MAKTVSNDPIMGAYIHVYQVTTDVVDKSML